MIDNIDYQDAGTSLSAPKYDRSREPMPGREELLARNSFGSPDDNKYLTTAAQRAATKAWRDLEVAQQQEARERQAKIQKKRGAK